MKRLALLSIMVISLLLFCSCSAGRPISSELPTDPGVAEADMDSFSTVDQFRSYLNSARINTRSTEQKTYYVPQEDTDITEIEMDKSQSSYAFSFKSGNEIRVDSETDFSDFSLQEALGVSEFEEADGERLRKGEFIEKDGTDYFVYSATDTNTIFVKIDYLVGGKYKCYFSGTLPKSDVDLSSSTSSTEIFSIFENIITMNSI